MRDAVIVNSSRMCYADTVGLKHVYERILAFHNQYGHHWQLAPLLARLVAEGRTFSSLDAHAVIVNSSRMCYADTAGLKHVYERILAFHEPAPRLVAEGRTFSSLDAQREREAHA